MVTLKIKYRTIQEAIEALEMLKEKTSPVKFSTKEDRPNVPPR